MPSLAYGFQKCKNVIIDKIQFIIVNDIFIPERKKNAAFKVIRFIFHLKNYSNYGCFYCVTLTLPQV